MATAKQRLCSKLGITENHLKGNNLFSPQANSTKCNTLDTTKSSKGEKAIKFFTTGNTDKKKKTMGVTAYQNYKIDILVPNSEPPKPLLTLDTAKNAYFRSQTVHESGFSQPMSPFRNTTTRDLSYTLNSTKGGNKANASHLENLNSNIKMNNPDMYSPVIRIKNKHQNDMTSKFNPNLI